jgi:putative ubiquitin-RnfH superfamily antitoxin RatB of RatAB toxin-antitoxin module
LLERLAKGDHGFLELGRAALTLAQHRERVAEIGPHPRAIELGVLVRAGKPIEILRPALAQSIQHLRRYATRQRNRAESYVAANGGSA